MHRTFSCRCENVVCFFLPAGLPRSDKLPLLNLLTGQKSCFPPSPGRLVKPIHVKLGMADGTWARLTVQNFTSIGAGVGMCNAYARDNILPVLQCLRGDAFVSSFVCHAPNPEHRAFEGCVVRTSISLPFIARFQLGFQRFFTRDCSCTCIACGCNCDFHLF